MGLCISFFFFGAYMALSPYHQPRHDVLAQLCQLQIFLTLAAAVLLKGDPRLADSPTLERCLFISSFFLPAFSAFLASPLSNYLLIREKRARVHRGLREGLARLRGATVWRRGKKMPPAPQGGVGLPVGGAKGRDLPTAGSAAKASRSSAASVRPRAQAGWEAGNPLAA
jgi:hypothetical protein